MGSGNRLAAVVVCLMISYDVLIDWIFYYLFVYILHSVVVTVRVYLPKYCYNDP